MDGQQVRRWIAGFEAAARVERQTAARRGAEPAWAIAIALSMIEAAVRAGRGVGADEPTRDAEARAVRETWSRLHRRLCR